MDYPHKQRGIHRKGRKRSQRNRRPTAENAEITEDERETWKDGETGGFLTQHESNTGAAAN
jgi:phage gp16-like protein